MIVNEDLTGLLVKALCKASLHVTLRAQILETAAVEHDVPIATHRLIETFLEHHFNANLSHLCDHHLVEAWVLWQYDLATLAAGYLFVWV